MSELEPTRTYSNPTATDVLRRMLDERGVEWGASDTYRLLVTSWSDASGHSWSFMEHRDGSFNKLTAYHLTPKQAIAATLGATDAKPTQVESSGTCEADETDTWECVRDDLGGYGKTMTVHVMECTECGHTYEHVNGDYEYCPRCGRKRRDVEE